MFRVPGFNNAPKGSGFVCFTWPSGNDMARCLEGPKVFSSPLFFFSFSFRIVFFLVIAVLFCFFI